MTCCECRWWRPSKEREHYTEIDDGECARFPPTVPCISRVTDSGIAVPEVLRGVVLTAYPIAYALEKCGEFERKRRNL